MAGTIECKGGWALLLALAIPLGLVVSDIVHRRLSGMKPVSVWKTLFGFGGLFSCAFGRGGVQLFKFLKGGGSSPGGPSESGGKFGGGGASGSW
jgi:uncharacterized membrane protein YgcG